MPDDPPCIAALLLDTNEHLLHASRLEDCHSDYIYNGQDFHFSPFLLFLNRYRSFGWANKARTDRPNITGSLDFTLIYPHKKSIMYLF